MNNLPAKERFLITERYMQRDLPYDFVVYEMKIDQPVSRGTFDKIKIRAFTLLALMLELQIDGLEQLLKP